MGQIYRVSRATHAQSTSNDSITIDVPAGRFLFVHKARVVGMANAAAAGAELGIFRTTANGSGGTPTSITLKNIDPNGASPPSGFTAKFGYSTQPTIESAPVARLSFQPLGGIGSYVALPGAPLGFWSASAYQLSLRGIAGTPNIAIEDLELELL